MLFDMTTLWGCVCFIDRYSNLFLFVLGSVTRFVGGGSATGVISGYADGIGSATTFYFPRSIAVHSLGTLYVADYNNNLIRKLTPTGKQWLLR